MSDEVDFYMQIIMKTWYKFMLWFWWEWPSITKVPKIASLQCFYNISKKSLKWNWFFVCRYTSKFPTNWYQPFGHQSFLQGNAIITAIIISKKKFWIEFILCIQVNVKVSTSWHYRFLWKWPKYEVGNIFSIY